MFCMIKKRNIVMLVVAALVVIGSLVTAFSINLSTIADIEQDNENLKQDNESLKAEITNIETKYEGAVKTYENRLATYRSDVEKLKNQNNDLSKRLTDSMTEAAKWKKKYLDSDTEDVEYSYSFDSVTALQNAVKKNPEAYYGKAVKVLTVVYEDSEDPYLYMFDPSVSIDSSSMSSFEWHYLVNKYNAMPALLDEYPLYAFIDSGDYVKMYGIVSVNSEATLCLSSCVFEVIQTSEERN